ncbi:hypothetical protein KC365_g4 [Hortaea werneckii]|nr:hypothetical protein KC339_g4 [Hortaea werneckii]KAI7245810.1 hypothetical protein KC365_g4 [Hortaea werneckii]
MIGHDSQESIRKGIESTLEIAQISSWLPHCVKKTMIIGHRDTRASVPECEMFTEAIVGCFGDVDAVPRCSHQRQYHQFARVKVLDRRSDRSSCQRLSKPRSSLQTRPLWLHLASSETTSETKGESNGTNDDRAKAPVKSGRKEMACERRPKWQPAAQKDLMGDMDRRARSLPTLCRREPSLMYSRRSRKIVPDQLWERELSSTTRSVRALPSQALRLLGERTYYLGIDKATRVSGRSRTAGRDMHDQTV